MEAWILFIALAALLPIGLVLVCLTAFTAVRGRAIPLYWVISVSAFVLGIIEPKLGRSLEPDLFLSLVELAFSWWPPAFLLGSLVVFILSLQKNVVPRALSGLSWGMLAMFALRTL
jgi:hypothetical protein